MINGYSVATLLRVEAVCLFSWVSLVPPLISKGFTGSTTRASPTILVIIMCLIGVVTVVY